MRAARIAGFYAASLLIVALLGHLEETALNFPTQMWWGTLRTGVIAVTGAVAYHFYLTSNIERN